MKVIVDSNINFVYQKHYQMKTNENCTTIKIIKKTIKTLKQHSIFHLFIYNLQLYIYVGKLECHF